YFAYATDLSYGPREIAVSLEIPLLVDCAVLESDSDNVAIFAELFLELLKQYVVGIVQRHGPCEVITHLDFCCVVGHHTRHDGDKEDEWQAIVDDQSGNIIPHKRYNFRWAKVMNLAAM